MNASSYLRLIYMPLGYFHPSVERHVILSADFLKQMQHVETPSIMKATMAIQCRRKEKYEKTKKHHCAIELGYLDEPHHVSMIGSNEETPLLEIAG
jgi:hypothetical protein